MAEVKWIKLTTTMFEDEKIDFIESLPEADAILVIWIKLLTQAGKCNSNGFIFLTEQIPYTEQMLAHKFRRPINVIKLALNTFTNLGMIELDEEGYINIVNWEKHQNIEGLEKIREQTRKRVAKHREKKKELQGNVTVTLGNAIEQEQEQEEELEQDIDIEQQQKHDSCCSSYPQEVVDKSQNDVSIIAKAFEQNGFGTLSATVKEMLVELLKEYSAEWIIEAFKIAVKANKRKLNYVEGILQNWRTQGGMKLEVEKTTNPSSDAKAPNKKNRFHNFEQRSSDYTADELEEIVKKKRFGDKKKVPKSSGEGISKEAKEMLDRLKGE